MAHEEPPPTAQYTRLAEADAATSPWRRFGPYVAERAWGTVPEDYSAGGDACDNLTYDEARSTAYRWNEDGMAALCDEEQYLCLGRVRRADGQPSADRHQGCLLARADCRSRRDGAGARAAGPRRRRERAYYPAVLKGLAAGHLPVARQAFAGLLWGKCF
jgi:hypothetical protein